MYKSNSERYLTMTYNRCGKSGLKLPAVSLGLWHNFGDTADYENMKALVFTAFDNGITHFDLANNYGPAPGSAERNFGKILKEELSPYRDELIISTKAGYDMWEGPYGNWGSRKYLLASLDQSLKRLGLDYVDIFYHHRPDPDTPLEETMGALTRAVRSGKALYAGLSNYDGETAARAAALWVSFFIFSFPPAYSLCPRLPSDSGGSPGQFPAFHADGGYAPAPFPPRKTVRPSRRAGRYRRSKTPCRGFRAGDGECHTPSG